MEYAWKSWWYEAAFVVVSSVASAIFTYAHSVDVIENGQLMMQCTTGHGLLYSKNTTCGSCAMFLKLGSLPNQPHANASTLLLGATVAPLHSVFDTRVSPHNRTLQTIISKTILHNEIIKGCGPGERQMGINHELPCTTFWPWPNALDATVQDTQMCKLNTSLLRCACGKWIDANLNQKAKRMSFDDEQQYADFVHMQQMRRSDPRQGGRMHFDPLSKFRAMCESEKSAGQAAAKAAAVLAYQFLGAKLMNVQSTVGNSNEPPHKTYARMTGALASASCTAPLQIDLGLDSNGFLAVALYSSTPTAKAAEAALLFIGESKLFSQQAYTSLQRYHHALLYRLDSRHEFQNQFSEAGDILVEFAKGALLWNDSFDFSSTDSTNMRIASMDATSDAALDNLAEQATLHPGPDETLQFFAGYAALCAISMLVDESAVQSHSSLLEYARQIKSQNKHAGLGKWWPSRVAARSFEHASHLFPENNEPAPVAHTIQDTESTGLVGNMTMWETPHPYKKAAFAMSSKRINQVWYPYSPSSSDVTSTFAYVHQHLTALDAQGTETCSKMAEAIYYNEIEDRIFSTVVGLASNDMYERLGMLTQNVSLRLQQIVQTNPGSIFGNPDAAAMAVKQTQVRVVGATMGTWGSAQVPVPPVGGAADLGSVVLAIKQATASILHKLSLVVNDEDPCKHPPLWKGSTTNAYHLHPFGCVTLFTGLLRRPFADGMYDTASMLNRIGAIVAHEIAHAVDYVSFDNNRREQLLSNYPKSTHNEGLADLLAAMAVIETAVDMGKSLNDATEEFILHWSQIWCSTQTLTPSTSHPTSETRAFLVCKTLKTLGYPCRFEQNVPLRAIL